MIFKPISVYFARFLPFPDEKVCLGVERHFVRLTVIYVAKTPRLNAYTVFFAFKVDMFARSLFVVHSEIYSHSARKIGYKLRRKHIRKDGIFSETRILRFNVRKRRVISFTHIRNETPLVIRKQNRAFSAIFFGKFFAHAERTEFNPFQKVVRPVIYGYSPSQPFFGRNYRQLYRKIGVFVNAAIPVLTEIFAFESGNYSAASVFFSHLHGEKRNISAYQIFSAAINAAYPFIFKIHFGFDAVFKSISHLIFKVIIS